MEVRIVDTPSTHTPFNPSSSSFPVGGFLDGHYPKAAKAIWDFEGIYASSRHIPHVRFVGLIHPGLMGCAPSAELLSTWNERERALVSTDPDRVPPLACLPLAQGTLYTKTTLPSPSLLLPPPPTLHPIYTTAKEHKINHPNP